MRLVTWLSDRYLAVRRQPIVRAAHRAVVHRVVLGWASVRRAWRRSLQLRMVVITLVVAGVLVGVFGMIVASSITEGVVNAKVNSAEAQVKDGAGVAVSGLAAIKDAQDTQLRQSLLAVLSRLASPSQQGENVIVVILPTGGKIGIEPLSQPSVAGVDQIVPSALRAKVASGKLAHQFITAAPVISGSQENPGPRPYLVYGCPVPVPFGQFELYYLFPLSSEEQAESLVRTTVIATGVALVVLLAVLTALTTRLVVRPVRVAARTAQRFSLGLFDQRMAVRGEDDLALLAASFNQMAENLQRQIIRLEEMSRLQRRFTSDVSHELRTPLTTVRLAADLIFTSREEFDPAVARSAELLQAELDRFEGLLTDLLEISRFDAGFAVLDAELTDVVPIVSRVVDRLSSLAERARVRLESQVPDQPVIAEIDSRRVERILRNLVGNAVEHGEGRPVRVTLATGDSAVAITVRDYGIGLRPGEEKLVFNRFWRSDPSRARQTGGSGLGLSISLEDARLHGGWLEAWGTPGGGAQFRLTLPLRAGDRLVSSPLRLVPDDVEVRPPLALTAKPAGLPRDGARPGDGGPRPAAEPPASTGPAQPGDPAVSTEAGHA